MFSFKSTWIFACAFWWISTCKTFPLYCLAGLHFVSEKNEDKISKRAQWTQQNWTRALKPKKDTGECFSTKLKSTCKNSGTFEGKEILPEKVTYVPLAPSHSIRQFLNNCAGIRIILKKVETSISSYN